MSFPRLKDSSSFLKYKYNRVYQNLKYNRVYLSVDSEESKFVIMKCNTDTKSGRAFRVESVLKIDNI